MLLKRLSKENQLDKLSHDSFEIYGTSGYYKRFCDQNIKTGKTYINRFYFKILPSKIIIQI